MVAATKSGPVTNVLEFDIDAIRAREEVVNKETDAEILVRLQERFNILNDMTRAVKGGDIRAMIVTGPPGVGKSYGVETMLQRDDLLTKIAGKKPKFEICKGAISSIGLYVKLYEFAAKGNVVVFDDCDEVLLNEESLNTLKGALDSSERRFISWNKDSRILRNEGIPDRFEFCGSAIFITNVKFEYVRSKKLKAHLNALESRCHYIDLQMDTMREKLLWLNHVVVGTGMLDRYDFDKPAEVRDDLLKYIEDNQNALREISLRMVLKIADMRKSFPTSWQSMCKTTCMKR